MKKPTKPTAKSAKTVKPAAKPAKAPVPVKKSPAKVVARTPVPAPAPAPAVRRVVPKLLATSITAQTDVGFGNSLYIRGEGAGLSWDLGLLMTCTADDAWSIKLPPATGPVTFKFLLNDLIWSTGENYTAAAGARVTVSPMF